MKKDFMEQPCTFGQFLDFFNKAIDPQLQEIPKLRADMKEGFRSVHGRLDYLFAKWEKLDQEYLIISHQLNRLDLRLDAIEESLRRLEGKSNKHEARLNNVDTKMNGLDAKINNFDVRLSKVEAVFEQHNSELQEIREKVGVLHTLALENERKFEENLQKNLQLYRNFQARDEQASIRLAEEKAEIKGQFRKLERRIRELEKKVQKEP